MAIKRVTLVTGASSGIGRTCSEHFHRRGWKVYGASRTIQSVDRIAFSKLAMDVTDASVARGVAHILEREGRLDAVVHAAGFGLAGAVEDTSLAEAQAQFETNFFSAARLCRAALPIMRAQRSGILVMISSLGGLAGIPFQAFYSASKFALEGMMEALRMEVKPFGIRVVLIEPGNFCTGLTASRQRTTASGPGSAYRTRFEAALDKQERDEMSGPDPEMIARLVEQVVNDPQPNLRYPVGRLEERIGAWLKRVLPYNLFEALMMWFYAL
jgi:NAD(P)-dependent dehydrogenase (short-subunit alcohol dehydrogenase family)